MKFSPADFGDFSRTDFRGLVLVMRIEIAFHHLIYLLK